MKKFEKLVAREVDTTMIFFIKEFFFGKGDWWNLREFASKRLREVPSRKIPIIFSTEIEQPNSFGGVFDLKQLCAKVTRLHIHNFFTYFDVFTYLVGDVCVRGNHSMLDDRACQLRSYETV